MKLSNSSFGILVTVISLALAQSICAESIAIHAGHLVDTAAGSVLTDQVILIEDGKIQSIAPDDGSVVEAETVIDLSESWVLPGLMDAHVHLTSNHEYANADYHGSYARESESYRAVRGVVVARQFLDAGFTTVKEIGNDGDYITAGIIQAIDKGWIEGPTILYAGKIIAPYGGQVGGYNRRNEGGWRYEFIDADSPAEIIKAIRQNLYYGATTIKLVTDQMGYYYTLEDIEAAVGEARRAGVTLTVHTMGGEAARNVILGGADGIEHGFFLDEELLLLMKEHGTYLVGTDFAVGNLKSYRGKEPDWASETNKKVVARLKLAYEIGVPMDKDRVESSLAVLESWEAAEIPPMSILQAMTANAADLMAIDEERGSLKNGLYADIIGLGENPLDDIDNVRSVHFVMKEGKVIRGGPD
jgi:imidazolonepropionase-like amidohydrolase